jgi:VanZ family protein
MDYFFCMIYFLFAVKQPVRIILVLLYVCCIAALSLLPPQDLPKVPLFPGADKIIHFLMYLVFSLLSCWALRTEKHFYRLFLIILISIGWGILMEYIQLAMHMGRSFSFYDVFANSLGVFVGILFYMVAARESEA